MNYESHCIVDAANCEKTRFMMDGFKDGKKGKMELRAENAGKVPFCSSMFICRVRIYVQSICDYIEAYLAYLLRHDDQLPPYMWNVLFSCSTCCTCLTSIYRFIPS